MKSIDGAISPHEWWIGENDLSFRDLEFDRLPVTQYSSRGTPWVKWVPVGMPRLPRDVTDCVFYLYESEEDAKAGIRYGGTGFFVLVPSEKYPTRFGYFYAVTNHHNSVSGKHSVIRINTLDGGVDTFDVSPDQWEWVPKYDIAVAEINIDPKLHRRKAISLDGLISEETMKAANVSIGEDVFMIGRFVDHDGGVTNRPAARFGCISVMPAPIPQPEMNNRKTDCFCLDLHSRTGFSGSPVFVYRTPGNDLWNAKSIKQHFTADGNISPDAEILLSGTELLMLLGIHFAQFPEPWQIREGKATPTNEGEPLIAGKYVQGMSGMTCVLPAWAIREVLEMPKLRAKRAEADLQIEKRLASEGDIPVSELDSRPEEETAKIRDEGLRRALNTPPKPKTKPDTV